MGSLEETLESGDYLEAQLLNDPVAQSDVEEGGEFGRVLYEASFAEMESSYVNYDTVQWILISLLLILVYGVGLLMLLYVPVRRYVSRHDIRTRRLLVTSNAIVYKVTRPVFLPCFGVSKREKNILLHLITDVVVEQGCLQSSFGISSVRLEGMGLPTPGDDVRIQGMANPRLFKKVVMMAASNLRRGQGASVDSEANMNGAEEAQLYETHPRINSQISSRQSWEWPRQSVAGLNSWQMRHNPVAPLQGKSIPITGDVLLRKLEGIEHSVKRIEHMLAEGQHGQPTSSEGLSSVTSDHGETSEKL